MLVLVLSVPLHPSFEKSETYVIYNTNYPLSRVMKAAGQAKAPLVHSEALVWLHTCVKDFGAGALPAPQVVAFAVSELEHVNPKVCIRCLGGVCGVSTIHRSTAVHLRLSDTTRGRKRDTTSWKSYQ